MEKTLTSFPIILISFLRGDKLLLNKLSRVDYIVPRVMVSTQLVKGPLFQWEYDRTSPATLYRFMKSPSTSTC